MSYGPPTKTVGDVYNYVKRVFGDEAGVQLSNDDITRWINEAQRDLAIENAAIQAVATTPLIVNQATYSLSGITPRINDISSLLIDGRRIGNIPVAQAEESISLADPEGAEVGAPQFWYEWADQIIFWPKPSQPGTITIRYTAEPTDVTTNSNDVLSLDDEYFMDIINYVLKQAYEMDENPEMMQAKATEYNQRVAERGEKGTNAQNMTYDTITVFDLY